MRKIATMILAVALIAVACGGSVTEPAPPAPEHPLLEGLERPPLNEPLTAAKTEPPLDMMPLGLPEDELPALLVLLGERPFVGTFREAGRLTVRSDRIELQPAEGDPLQILYRLPLGVEKLAEGTGEGSVDVTELSGPDGADRSVMVRDARALFFVEVWRNSATPLTVQLSDRLSLVQRRTDAADGDGSYTEVELSAFHEGELVVRIPIGEPTLVKTNDGAFQVFSEVSHLFTPPKTDLGQYPRAYILHVWVVRLR